MFLRQKKQSLLDKSDQQLTISINPEGTILENSKNITNFLGYENEELQGKNPLKPDTDLNLISKELREKYLKDLGLLISGNYQKEYDVKSPNEITLLDKGKKEVRMLIEDIVPDTKGKIILTLRLELNKKEIELTEKLNEVLNRNCDLIKKYDDLMASYEKISHKHLEMIASVSENYKSMQHNNNVFSKIAPISLVAS